MEYTSCVCHLVLFVDLAAKLRCENTRGIHFRMMSRSILSISLYFVNYSDTLIILHSVYDIYYISYAIYIYYYVYAYGMQSIYYYVYAYGYCGFDTTTLRRAQTRQVEYCSHICHLFTTQGRALSPHRDSLRVFINCFSITYTVLLFTCLGLSKDNVVHNTVLTRL